MVSETQLFAEENTICIVNRKLLGYYNYYGVTGNFQSLNSFVYHVKGLFFK